MATLNLVLPDALFRSLETRARNAGQSLDEFALRFLERTLTESDGDPLLQMLGTLDSDAPDLGERHDAYLSQTHTISEA